MERGTEDFRYVKQVEEIQICVKKVKTILYVMWHWCFLLGYFQNLV